MRAAIYARYSSDLQSAASIEDQIRLCRHRIEREGWSLIASHSDRAISGASHLRPGFQALLEQCRAGAIDVVVAEALDRISRDQEHIAAFYKQLSFAGVRILTLSDGFIDELHVGLKGTMNALFLKDLAAKTRRGLQGRIEAGRSAGSLSYGYVAVPQVAADGTLVRGARAIHPEQAAIVRRIFSEFVAGRSPVAIAKRLNTERIAGPGGRPWSGTTIRGHATRGTGILHNELYVGRLVWNRQRYAKDPSTGKRLARPNPPDQWIIKPVPELRIVDQQLWDQAAVRLHSIEATPYVQKMRASRFWEKRRAQHLVSGLTLCGDCGKPFATIGKDYLGCSTARNTGTCGNKRSIRRAAIENLVLDGLRHQLMAPDLVAEFTAAYHEEVNRQRAGLAGDRNRQQQELTGIERRIASLVDSIADGLDSPAIRARLAELESRKAALAAEVVKEAPTPVRLHPNLSELYRQKVADLHLALADPQIGSEALSLLRSLIERIVVRPLPEGGFELEIVGAIAAMVGLGQSGADNKKAAQRAAVSAVDECSVKVVAGARFELTTFRL